MGAAPVTCPHCGRDYPQVPALTPREVTLLGLLAQGNNLHQSAGRMAISVKTAETHSQHIKYKLGLRNTYQLVAYACKALGAATTTTLEDMP